MDPLSQRNDQTPKAKPETESNSWTVPDLIDFDYYVDADERAMRERPAERDRLADRDRKLYLERIRDAAPRTAAEHSPQHRSAALHAWLLQQRRIEDPALRPLLPGCVVRPRASGW